MDILEQVTKVPLAKKLSVLLLMLLLLAAGYWFVYYSPVIEELDGLRAEYESLTAKFKEAEKRKATYDQDRRNRDELKKAYSKQIRTLPPDAEMSSFLADLNAQAELVGIEILSIRPMVEQPAQYYARIPVDLRIRGNYYQLAKFFYLVGNLDRIINIENINFTGATMDESAVTIDAAVMATTFRAVDPGGANARKGGA
ncbi:MAG: type 4a pilus biogenesis protein PilO [Deltaproteobacteria bacterium]|nr:type 4a pilus biogenesis protein PilO [Deltaproteobacteria bacterium]